MKTLRTLLTALSLLPALWCVPVAVAQPVAKDGVLTTPAGMSLYVNENDKTTPGKTVCHGPCLMLWKPYLAAADAKPRPTVAKRSSTVVFCHVACRPG